MSQPRRFEDKVALVTGSSRGLGKALARRLAAEGARVIVNSANTPVDGRLVAREIQDAGHRAVFVRASMESEADIQALAELVGRNFGRVDVVVHNAAGGCECEAVETTWQDFERTFRVNTFALIALARHLSPLMPDGGKMLFVSSFGATRAVPGYAVVGASKAASEALVRSLAMELAPRVQVNAIRPAVLPTVSLRAFSLADEFLRLTANEAPLGPGGIDEVIGAAAFLCSSEADYVTGQTLDV